MLRFLLDVWCRCGVDVSTMDTRAPSDLRYQSAIASGVTSSVPESRPSGRLGVLAPTCLRSEETARSNEVTHGSHVRFCSFLSERG